MVSVLMVVQATAWSLEILFIAVRWTAGDLEHIKVEADWPWKGNGQKW